jgi:deoxycytidine triphosphate deaminase
MEVLPEALADCEQLSGFLSDSQIQAAISAGFLFYGCRIVDGSLCVRIAADQPEVEKPIETVIRHASFELWVGQAVQRLKPPDPLDEANRSGAGEYRQATYENKRIHDDGSFRIDPGDTYKIWGEPRLKLPTNVLALVAVSGSINEAGLVAGDTYADPGFPDNLFVIVRNASQRPVVLKTGDRLARIFFYRLGSPAKNPHPGRGAAVEHARGRFLLEGEETSEERIETLERRSAVQDALMFVGFFLVGSYIAIQTWGVQNLWAKIGLPILCGAVGLLAAGLKKVVEESVVRFYKRVFPEAKA